MTYQEFNPSDKLKSIIDSFWLFSDSEKVEDERILPDGCMDIIFNLGNSTSSIQKNTIGISGMMTTFSNESFNENSDLFGIRFKSGMLSKFAKFPMFEIKNQTIEASEIIPEFNIETIEKLEEQKSIEQKLQFIELRVCNILNKQKTSNDALIFLVIP